MRAKDQWQNHVKKGAGLLVMVSVRRGVFAYRLAQRGREGDQFHAL